jgi:hypothetical protein
LKLYTALNGRAREYGFTALRKAAVPAETGTEHMYLLYIRVCRKRFVLYAYVYIYNDIPCARQRPLRKQQYNQPLLGSRCNNGIIEERWFLSVHAVKL